MNIGIKKERKEQFISGIDDDDDDDVMTKFLRELTAIKKTNEITGEQVYYRGLDELRLKKPRKC